MLHRSAGLLQVGWHVRVAALLVLSMRPRLSPHKMNGSCPISWWDIMWLYVIICDYIWLYVSIYIYNIYILYSPIILAINNMWLYMYGSKSGSPIIGWSILKIEPQSLWSRRSLILTRWNWAGWCCFQY
jgi:hypothetical protein